MEKIKALGGLVIEDRRWFIFFKEKSCFIGKHVGGEGHTHVGAHQGVEEVQR